MKTAALGELLPTPPARDQDGLLLPFNLEAERSTLGAAVLYTVHADYISDRLGPEAYHRRAHATLFEAIRALRRRGVEVDFVTMQAELGPKGMDAIGGPSYLASLTDGVPKATNVSYYADILRDLQAKRALIAFANRTLDHVVAGQHTSEVLIADADRRLIELQSGHVNSRMSSLADEISGVISDLDWRVAHRGELTGVETGFASINELTMGWQKSDLIVGAARPSMGKTTIAMNMATAAARTGASVAVFSLEMRKKQLANRMVSSLSCVPLTRIKTGYLGASDYPKLSVAFETLSTFHIEIDDRSGQTIWDIRAKCRQLHGERRLDLVIIDYVQLIPGTLSRKGATRNDELTDISRRCKVMADEINAPVILLSQLNRAAKGRQDKRPQLEDLRDCGALEQDADVVWFLHRKHQLESGTTQFIFGKARNDAGGTVNITLDRDTVTFTDGGDDPPPDEKPRKRSKKGASTAQADLPVEDDATS